MAADVKRSEFNPFRTPAVTPNPTGSGPSTSTSNNIPTPSMPQSQLQLSTSSADPSRNETNPPRMERPPADDLTTELEATALDDNASSEPPPAYTPAANPYEGEATVEYGPRRPFQPAPPPPPLPQQFTGISQGGYFVSPQVTGLPMVANQTGGWGHYPGQGVRGSGPAVNICPPPQHPSMRVRGSDPGLRVSSASTPHRPLSEFARDFYAATLNDGRALSPTPSDVSSAETPDPEQSERVSPTVNTSSSYAPPPGPPPPRHPPPSGPPPSSPTSPGASSPTSLHGPPGGPPPPRPPRVVSNNADDWKPTNTPTPGRPLLNKGRVLMYPSGYECRKCLNTGYKNFDPSHPCKKCWEKYARPYSGAIIYAPRSQQSQKPLPSFRPPHLRHQQSQSQPSLLYPPPPSSNLSHSQSVYRPTSSTSHASGGYPVSPVSNPGAGGSVAPPPQPMQTPRPQLSFTRGMPPPGSTIVQPGDARIGGRLCWRCGGDGTVSFLIFDVERCPICNGLGRTFQ